jgi:hypothetical protein
MRTRSAPVVTVVAALAALAGAAAPAFAHEEIAPKTFPTGQPTFFTLTAANEESANLVKVVLHAPAGVPFGTTTRSPAGWSVTRTDDTITWTGGVVKPDTFDTWGYEIEGADQPATLAYKVTLGFADAKSNDVEVDVNAVVPGATGATGAGAAPGAATTVTTGATTPTTAGDDESAGGGGSEGGSGTAKAALAVAIVALLVAAGALAVGGRRRGPGGAGGGGGAGAAQDW